MYWKKHQPWKIIHIAVTLKKHLAEKRGVAVGTLLKPAPLVVRFSSELEKAFSLGPVLDLACGKGHNGLYLASIGAAAVLTDRDRGRLAIARDLANKAGVTADFLRMDLEEAGVALPKSTYGIILVFRYLHRPLMQMIKDALVPGGLVVYETFTEEQRKYGKPHNPDYLLRPGELKSWFRNWDLLHHFEGHKEHPQRAIAQIICRKRISVI